MPGRIPPYLARCFWSYRLSALDLQQSKELIITQVLNWADLKGIRWLFRRYPKKEIITVLKSPRRGVWLRDVLNFWLTVFNLRIPRDTYALAIREIDPAKVDQKALLRFFKRLPHQQAGIKYPVKKK